MSEVRYFPGKIARWVDGDTCRVDIDQGFYDWKLNRELRLYGYDAPERRSKNEKERALGSYAKDLMESKFPPGTEIIIESRPQERGKYGRVIGSFAVEGGTTWVAALINARLVVEYGKFSDEELAAVWDKRYELLIGRNK